MAFRVVNTPELVAFILQRFGARGASSVADELTRFFWNHAGFREALLFDEDGAGRIAERDYRNNFLYDRHTGLVFFDLCGSSHQLLMAYLQALHETDFPEVERDWFSQHFGPFNAESLLADRYVELGNGILLSSVGARNNVYVAQAYPWSDAETSAFASYQRQTL